MTKKQSTATTSSNVSFESILGSTKETPWSVSFDTHYGTFVLNAYRSQKGNGVNFEVFPPGDRVVPTMVQSENASKTLIQLGAALWRNSYRSMSEDEQHKWTGNGLLNAEELGRIHVFANVDWATSSPETPVLVAAAEKLFHVDDMGNKLAALSPDEIRMFRAHELESDVKPFTYWTPYSFDGITYRKQGAHKGDAHNAQGMHSMLRNMVRSGVPMRGYIPFFRDNTEEAHPLFAYMRQVFESSLLKPRDEAGETYGQVVKAVSTRNRLVGAALNSPTPMTSVSITLTDGTVLDLDGTQKVSLRIVFSPANLTAIQHVNPEGNWQHSLAVIAGFAAKFNDVRFTLIEA